jgi:hypothetical protein
MPSSYEDRNQLIKILANQAYFDAINKPKNDAKAIQVVGTDGQTGRKLLRHPDGGVTSNGEQRFNTAVPSDGFVAARIDPNSNTIAIDGRQRRGDALVNRIFEEAEATGLIIAVAVLKEGSKSTVYIIGDRSTPDEVYTYDNTKEDIGRGHLVKTGEDLDDWAFTALIGEVGDIEGTAQLISITSSGVQQKLNFPDYKFGIGFVLKDFMFTLYTENNQVGGSLALKPSKTCNGCRDEFASNYNLLAGNDSTNNTDEYNCIYDPAKFEGRCLIKVTGTKDGNNVSYMMFNLPCSELSGTAPPPRVTGGGSGGSYVEIKWTNKYGTELTNTFGSFSTSPNRPRYYAEVINKCVRGCTDSTRENFNLLANQDDGSCAGVATQIGCADGFAANRTFPFDNYNTCIYRPIDTANTLGYFLKFIGTYNNGTAFNYTIPLTARFHDFGLGDRTFHPALPSPYIEVNRYTYTYKNPNELYWFINVFYGGQVIYSAYKEGTLTSYELITGGKSIVNGCTDINATNYDPSANFEDGTCTYDLSKYNKVDGSLSVDITLAIASLPSTTVKKTVSLIGDRNYTAKTEDLEFTIFDGKTIKSKQILLEYPEQKLTPSSSDDSYDFRVVYCDTIVAYDPDKQSCLVTHYEFATGEFYVLRYTNDGDFNTPEKYRYSDFSLFFSDKPFVPFFRADIMAHTPVLISNIFFKAQGSVNLGFPFSIESPAKLIGNKVFFYLSYGFKNYVYNASDGTRPDVSCSGTLTKGKEIGTVSMDYIETDYYYPDFADLGNSLEGIDSANYSD